MICFLTDDFKKGAVGTLFLKKPVWFVLQFNERLTHFILILELEITPIPVALDNYAYIIMETESNTCVVIDVGDEEAVIVRCL